MRKIYHLEINGKTNTGIYVSKIIAASKFKLSCEYSLKVFTSNLSTHTREDAIPVFGEYGNVSNKLLKIYYYVIGFLKVFHYLYRKKNKSSFLHLHWLKLSPFDLVMLSLIKSSTNTKLVFTIHNVLPHEHSVIDEFIYPYIYSKIDAFIFHSKSSYYRLVNEMKIDVRKYVIIPHFAYEVGEHSVDLKKNSILFFGSIRDYKGLDVLLEACAKLPADTEWSLSIYGKPEMNIDNLKELCIQKNIAGHVEWNTGWIEEEQLDDIFYSHEIVILPYKEIDNSGLLHLAMSYGKPVIASRLGSLADLIKDGENGLLFEACNSEELSKKILKLLMDDELKEMLGNNARLLMEKEHSLERIGLLHAEFYNKLL